MEHQSVNGYTLRYKLGEGGMAEVWYALNVLQKPAAIKILQKRFCNVPEVVSRFENEAKLMVHLSHPHIRNIYDYATIDDCPCMIMEYLEGHDLSQRLKSGEKFSNQQLIIWWNDLVDALQYTHRKNVIHRDIKPSNLFITEDNKIKILDFGIAKLRDNVGLTQTGSRMGTLLYMSPEQVYDLKTLTYKTDVYSLAVTFYHLVTGQAPYDTTKISDFEIQENIVRKPIDTTILPAPWNSLLPGYLYKNAEDRKELRKIDDGIAMSNDETVVFDPAIPPPPVKNIEPAYTPVVAPPKRRKSISSMILLWLLIVGGIVTFAVNKDAILRRLQRADSQPKQRISNVNTKPQTNNLPEPLPIDTTAIQMVPDTTVSEGDNGAVDQVVTSVDLGEQETNIKNTLNDYYRSRSDCNTLYRFFGDTVKQYYNKSNVSMSSIMKECESYHGKWKFTEANINNESYVFTHNQNGGTTVSFNMLYKIKQNEEDDWIPYNIDVTAVFDADKKIQRIVETRIEKL